MSAVYPHMGNCTEYPAPTFPLTPLNPLINALHALLLGALVVTFSIYSACVNSVYGMVYSVYISKGLFGFLCVCKGFME